MNDYDLQEALVKSKLQRFQQQAQTAAPEGRMVGRVFVAPNPLEYLAAGLRSYGGMKGEQQAQSELVGLGQKRQTAMADALRNFGQKMKGTEAQPGFEVPANEMDGQTQMNPVAAQAPDAMGAYQGLIASGMPELQKMGMQGALEVPKLEAQKAEHAANRDWRTQESQLARDARAQEAQLAREARAADLQARLADARTSQAERLSAQRELRQMQIDAQRDLKQFGASLAAGMRQPEAPVAVMGPDGNPIYVSRKDAIGKSPVEKTAASKPLGNKELTQLQEARESAASMDALNTTFKPEFGGKGVYGIGADIQMGAAGNMGFDKDAVDWWKNYKKQAELVERHAMFGASLTANEQASWRSADVAPGMNPSVIKKNLATRANLTKKVLSNTRADLIDAGHGEKRISSIADRGGAGAVLANPVGAKFLGFE